MPFAAVGALVQMELGWDLLRRVLVGTLTASDALTEESMASHDPSGQCLCIHSVVVEESLRRRGLGSWVLYLRHALRATELSPAGLVLRRVAAGAPGVDGPRHTPAVALREVLHEIAAQHWVPQVDPELVDAAVVHAVYAHKLPVRTVAHDGGHVLDFG